MSPVPPLPLTNRWTGISNDFRVRLARLVNRDETARRIEALLREIGAPVAYEVFGHEFVLCSPEFPDIAFVIGDAEHDLFFVAQRERVALGRISIHERVHDAADDFLRRATDSVGRSHIAKIIALDGAA